MKTSRYAAFASTLLFLAGIRCLAAEAAAPDAPPADAPAEATPASPNASGTRDPGFRPQTQVPDILFRIITDYNSNDNAVTQQNQPFQEGLTLTQLIKKEESWMHGGPILKVWLGNRNSGARGGRGAIIGGIQQGGRRGGPTVPSNLALVDYAAIQAGQAKDIVLSQGDIVTVQTAYVYAGVVISGGPFHRDTLPYQEGMTVMQVVKTEQKNVNWVDLGNITMGHIHSSPTNTNVLGADTAVKVDYAAIASGKEKDIPLLPGYWVRMGVKPFVFEGGTPRKVIQAIEDFFGVDLSMANIPPEMADVQVPKFRIGEPTGANDVMQIYNQLGAKIPALGQWLWENNGGGLDPTYFSTPPGLLMLIPDKTTAQANADKRTVKARAISIANIPAGKWNALQNDIMEADAGAQHYIRETGGTAVDRGGTVQIQADSKILIAIGIPSFIELSESVVAAYETNKPPAGQGMNPSPPAK